MPNFSFIQPSEADLFRRICEDLKREFGQVVFLEIGTFGGRSTNGIAEHCRSIGVPLYAAGVDCMESYKPDPLPTPDYDFYFGDSMDQWRHIKRRDFNWLFVDACHCVNHAMCDFLNYSPFLVKGGICVFHDTALPEGKYDQEPWPQDHGFAGKPPSQLGVREGLKKLGLLQGYRKDWEFVEEIPSSTGMMGMVVLKKILDL
jgi:hypothetical protein